MFIVVFMLILMSIQHVLAIKCMPVMSVVTNKKEYMYIIIHYKIATGVLKVVNCEHSN